MSDARYAYDLLRTEGQFWALDPSHLEGLIARIARQASLTPQKQQAPQLSPQNTAVVSIVGPLVKRGSFLSEMFGLSSYSRIQAQLAQAVADRAVDRILLYIDSPGGSVAGCEETAAAVASAARVKPVHAYCDGLIASAALWIGSQANSITITPSGEAGSVGVIALHLDMSEALKQAGVVPTFLISKVSPRKADLNSYQPINPEAKARAQADIDKIAAKFVATVARGRLTTSAVVADLYGKGDCLLADAALRAGMVDKIGSIADALNASPAGRGASSGRPASAADAYRSRIAELSANPNPFARRQAELARHRLAILKES